MLSRVLTATRPRRLMDMASRSAGLILRLCIALAASRACAPAAESRLEFEVASVKPSDHGVRTPNVVPGAGGSLTITNVPLRMIIIYAYDLRDFQLAGGPGWIGDERYDIVAKAAATDHDTHDETTETDDQRKSRVGRVRERLRSLLSDRFGLRVHVEQREHTILDLQIAKGGPKLAEAVAKTDKSGTVSWVNGHIQGYAAPISMLATQLSVATGLFVRDETSLRGRYDFALDWAPGEQRLGSGEKDQGDTRPSIFAAIIEQLGLRLERAREPVTTVVIDHVERPSAN